MKTLFKRTCCREKETLSELISQICATFILTGDVNWKKSVLFFRHEVTDFAERVLAQ